jgi:hypothetical protein
MHASAPGHMVELFSGPVAGASSVTFISYGENGGGVFYLGWTWENLGSEGPAASPWTSVVAAIIAEEPWSFLGAGAPESTAHP